MVLNKWMLEENDMEAPEKKSVIRRVISAVLAVFLLAAVFCGCIGGLVKDPRALLESLKTYRAREYLPEGRTDFFDMTSARLASLESQLGRQLPLNDEMSELNADFQFGLNKRTIVSGSQVMYRLPNGQLYYLSQYETLRDQAEAVADFYRGLNGTVPFLFCYIHPGFFNGGFALPEGYDVIDRGDELGDEILAIMRSAGAETMDSRTFFEGTGYTNDDLELKTDKHWTSLAALLAARLYAEKINELTGAHLDASRLDPGNFRTERARLPYDGSYGRKIGHNATLDDVTVYVPDHATELTRHTLEHTGKYVSASGPFEESVLRKNKLVSEENGVNTEAHMALGLTLGYEEIVNHGACEDLTVLVVRDSYTCPICAYLSLLTRRVVSVDLRYDDRSVSQLMEQCEPDIVIVSLSRMMMETVDIRGRF
ncbi:MAG: hypothetical protein IJH78_09070 [Clostridia bacterium]|nr:hypothetical protein [Clostridia bacterium]